MQQSSVLPIACLNTNLKLKGFKAYLIESVGTTIPDSTYYTRRDFYKICLVTGQNKIHYAEEQVATTGTLLFFARPQVAYCWETISLNQSGYSCLFTEDFFSRHPRLKYLLQSPLVAVSDIAIFSLNQSQRKDIAVVFQQILSAQDSQYVYKDELIANCLHLLILEGLKRQPWENF